MTLASRPVHAVQDSFGRVPGSAGINLRQHYAGLAMQALASAPDETGMWKTAPHDAAKLAVEYADALLEELGK